MTEFEQDVIDRAKGFAEDEDFRATAAKFVAQSAQRHYMYNFFWLGRPIIQYPQDIVAFQEIVWQVKPDLIIETGIAHGGSLILSASLLAMIDYCEAAEKGETLTPGKSHRKVVGVDIDIRDHNRAAMDAHPLRPMIEMIQGSAIDEGIAAEVASHAKGMKRVLVSLDSNHTHEHVLRELELYAPLVTKDSYCIVFDTLVEDMPADAYPDRPWGPGDNPKTAVWEYLKSHSEFEIDRHMHDKLQITVAPDGFLKRVS